MADGTSIRDSLKAVMDEARDVDAAPATVAPVEAPAAETPPVAETPTPEAAIGAPERDEQGRFKPKTETPGAEGAQAAAPPQKTEPETAKPASEGPETQATPIPPSLSAAVKAQWADLPEQVRKDFARLEETVQTAKAEWGRKGERLNRYDEIIGPRREKWALHGLDEFQGIQTLLAAQDILDRNPAEGLIHVARSYGVTAQQIAQALGLQTSAPQPGAEGFAPTATPGLEQALQAQLAPVMQRFQTLEQQLAAQSQASEAAAMAKTQAEVDAFRNDPKNLYFENVRHDIVKMIQAGAEGSLSELYERAIWASPETRPLLLAEQAKQAQASVAAKAADEARRTHAAQAAQAAGSVTGSPTPGAQPLTPGPALPLREELAANLKAARAQV